MKGHGGWFAIFSIAGIIIGLALLWHGFRGEGLSSLMVILLGLFVTIKELTDLMHG